MKYLGGFADYAVMKENEMRSDRKSKGKTIKQEAQRGGNQEGKPQAKFIPVLKRFIKVNKVFIPAFCLVMVLIIISKALTASMNIIIGMFFDNILSRNYAVFYKGSILLCILQLIKSTIQYQINNRANYTSEGCIKNMRNYTYHHVTGAAMQWLDSNKVGDIISRINGDLSTFTNIINRFLTYQLSNMIDFLVSVIACFVVNWRLSVISFCLIPVIGGLQMLIGRPVARLTKKRAESEGRANAIFLDLLGGIAILKAFGIEKEMYQRHEREVDQAVEASKRSYMLEFILQPLQFLMSMLPMMLILATGSIFVIRGETSFGDLLAFIMLSNNVINIVSGLSYQVREIYNIIGIADRIFDLWDVELEDKGGTAYTRKNECPIRFENVSFFYSNDIPVLKDINFTIEKGENVAIVGESGAGKSTVIKLLAGFYEKTGGDIYIYGNKIEDWNKAELRRYMSYAGQDVFLFPGSILSNVMLAREGATMDEAKQVLEEVGLSSLDITKELSEGGIKLSGGQRQRICIARVLLKNSEIILLDEPTSALDTESEACVNTLFDRWRGDRTCITIAHRLSAIHKADRIICLKKGRIAEMGKHEELMRLGGVYYELYQKQRKEAAI